MLSQLYNALVVSLTRPQHRLAWHAPHSRAGFTRFEIVHALVGNLLLTDLTILDAPGRRTDGLNLIRCVRAVQFLPRESQFTNGRALHGLRVRSISLTS
ncbi:hypothetical protein Spb1_06310 [Planctopirus ephydatiae]|uniref:Uncharacterized protein n=1 Tax=Planctopirus ephydatiae TaxID=2528019 RepID=A0A518GJJ7_9PLAN|nr:hypothetical protein Spb1_06310 [Planctopirus ephydatiae]